VALNVVLAYFAYVLDLPVYLDTIGTIFMSALGGTVPGLFVAVVTNILCGVFNNNALYFSLINVITALLTSWLMHDNRYLKFYNVLLYFLGLFAVNSVLGGLIEQYLFHSPFNLLFIAFATADKIVSAGIAFIVYSIIPLSERKAIWYSAWRQNPDYVAGRHIDSKKKKWSIQKKKWSIQKKMTSIVGFSSLFLVLVMSWVSVNTYYQSASDINRNISIRTARFASDIVDGDRVEEYLEKGPAAEGYNETRDLLEQIRKNAYGVKFLYVYQVKEDGYHVVFDLDTPDVKADPVGSVVPFDESYSEYLDDLIAGKEVGAVESKDKYGWLLTAYEPIRDSSGKTVAYACADSSLAMISSYTEDYLLKTLLVFGGFFIMVIGMGLWYSKYHLVNPITSITECAQEFIHSERDQKTLDENVKKIRKIDVHTDDDVEELYNAICAMEADMAEQMRDIRHYADATAKMQNGLIITMADLVENPDFDMSSNIQRTAAYARIIVEGLKKKGYYAEKITPQFISDVIISAPLHDIGKVNIPDTILNKPGKLTEEEFEVIKTHAVYGRKIIERAIDTIQGESYLKEALNMAAYHHERWDGKGYPEGLHGQVIPLSARIMAIADVFDALTSERVYKSAYSFEKSMDIIQEGSGTQFDPKCVEAFMDSMTDVKIVLKTYQNR
jgi:HD-GYP domain-containing protein (c-di-GMP phosphodiesterase class II)